MQEPAPGSLSLPSSHGAGQPGRTVSAPVSGQEVCPSGCKDVPLPGQLLLSASLDLNALEPLIASAELDSRALPPNTLLIELADGLYVWPPSQHLLRTASGAVPAEPVAAAPTPAAAAAAAPPSAWSSPQVCKRSAPSQYLSTSTLPTCHASSLALPTRGYAAAGCCFSGSCCRCMMVVWQPTGAEVAQQLTWDSAEEGECQRGASDTRRLAGLAARYPHSLEVRNLPVNFGAFWVLEALNKHCVWH